MTFDELDFVIFSGAMWNRMGESHANNIRVHWPDGHFTDGLDRHVADLEALFAWAPDTHIHCHPPRLAKDNLTCVTGVMAGTFSQPMPDGNGGFIQPTGKAYSINMATVGIWNGKGTMDEEFLFGSHVLVAPVTTKGATTRRVYLPMETNDGETALQWCELDTRVWKDLRSWRACLAHRPMAWSPWPCPSSSWPTWFRTRASAMRWWRR